MAILDVLKYPHVQLRQECKPVGTITDEIRGMCQDLVDTMYDHDGAVGLSAPQVGYPLRIVAIDVTAKTTRDQLRVLINPTIVKQSRNKLVREGCLSFPSYLANVKRSTRITCEYLTPEGDTKEWTAESQLEAIAIQHEIDHLDGVLMIDRVNSLKTDLIRRVTA